uniref:Uncharacterized protein n=1 Tax=Eukaryota sp. BB2 TaxID=1949062 RepID=A0A1W7AF19_9EUKA|nr:hypothetical protein CCM08_mgp44 [Eukaryota sp. BB2]ARQ20676.1 hypothetical protein [Eukaryota sp. BB2]
MTKIKSSKFKMYRALEDRLWTRSKNHVKFVKQFSVCDILVTLLVARLKYRRCYQFLKLMFQRQFIRHRYNSKFRRKFLSFLPLHVKIKHLKQKYRIKRKLLYLQHNYLVCQIRKYRRFMKFLNSTRFKRISVESVKVMRQRLLCCFNILIQNNLQQLFRNGILKKRLERIKEELAVYPIRQKKRYFKIRRIHYRIRKISKFNQKRYVKFLFRYINYDKLDIGKKKRILYYLRKRQRFRIKRHVIVKDILFMICPQKTRRRKRVQTLYALKLKQLKVIKLLYGFVSNKSFFSFVRYLAKRTKTFFDLLLQMSNRGNISFLGVFLFSHQRYACQVNFNDFIFLPVYVNKHFLASFPCMFNIGDHVLISPTISFQKLLINTYVNDLFTREVYYQMNYSLFRQILLYLKSFCRSKKKFGAFSHNGPTTKSYFSKLSRTWFLQNWLQYKYKLHGRSISKRKTVLNKLSKTMADYMKKVRQYSRFKPSKLFSFWYPYLLRDNALLILKLAALGFISQENHSFVSKFRYCLPSSTELAMRSMRFFTNSGLYDYCRYLLNYYSNYGLKGVKRLRASKKQYRRAYIERIIKRPSIQKYFKEYLLTKRSPILPTGHTFTSFTYFRRAQLLIRPNQRYIPWYFRGEKPRYVTPRKYFKRRLPGDSNKSSFIHRNIKQFNKKSKEPHSSSSSYANKNRTSSNYKTNRSFQSKQSNMFNPLNRPHRYKAVSGAKNDNGIQSRKFASQAYHNSHYVRSKKQKFRQRNPRSSNKWEVNNKKKFFFSKWKFNSNKNQTGKRRSAQYKHKPKIQKFGKQKFFKSFRLQSKLRRKYHKILQQILITKYLKPFKVAKRRRALWYEYFISIMRRSNSYFMGKYSTVIFYSKSSVNGLWRALEFIYFNIQPLLVRNILVNPFYISHIKLTLFQPLIKTKFLNPKYR